MNNQSQLRVGVVGGGLGGLAAACTLAARGHEVSLWERSEWLGGKAAVWRQDGFRFDMGPTILTLPGVLEKIFAEAGKKLSDAMRLVRLDPQWRCFFTDGAQLDLVESTEAMQRRIAHLSGNERDVAGYGEFLRISRRLHDVSDKFFFWKSVGGIGDAMDFAGAVSPRVLSDVLSLRFGRSVAGLVRSCISDERVAQMIDHFTQYVGSSPSASPAVLCGIAHMQTQEGVWYPIGGTRAVPEALVSLAKTLGVQLHTSAPVASIEVSGGRVQAVVTAAGDRTPLDAVVSNCDSVLTHQELLPEQSRWRFSKRRRYEPACSGVVLYLGLRRRYEHLLHHNFVFSSDPEEEFAAIYERGEPAPDPTCYVCAPSRTEPETAPAGGEALYVLAHTPYLRPGHDWSTLGPQYRQVILNKLKSTGGMPDLEERVVCERMLTPQDIQDRYHVPAGAIYGLASHGRFLGAFKPANRSPDVQGLYLAGGSAHPGPGMPMVLMSGWIAADTLDQDVRSPKRRPLIAAL